MQVNERSIGIHGRSVICHESLMPFTQQKMPDPPDFPDFLLSCMETFRSQHAGRQLILLQKVSKLAILDSMDHTFSVEISLAYDVGS